MLVASTSVEGFNCITPAASSSRTPPSRPRSSGLLVGKSIQPSRDFVTSELRLSSIRQRLLAFAPLSLCLFAAVN
jgi:hypothetical protein